MKRCVGSSLGSKLSCSKHARRLWIPNQPKPGRVLENGTLARKEIKWPTAARISLAQARKSPQSSLPRSSWQSVKGVENPASASFAMLRGALA